MEPIEINPAQKRMWQLVPGDLIYRLGRLQKVISVNEKEIVLKDRFHIHYRVGSLSKEIVDYRGQAPKKLSKEKKKTNPKDKNGIYFHANENRWVVYLLPRKPRRYLGCFKTKEAAIAAQKRAFK